MRYYVHGAGRAGAQAWPRQPRTSVFADHSATPRMQAKAALVHDQAPTNSFVLIAHSLGAVASAIAMREHRLSPRCLVLVEPALYDVARGEASIEGHIGPMSRARDRAAHGDLFGFWEIVAPLMFDREANRQTWAEDEPIAARMASMDPPWGHRVEATICAHAPTLVLTGAWNAEYEAIAARLAQAGARTRQLIGNGYRVQDHPEFNAAVDDFAADHGC